MAVNYIRAANPVWFMVDLTGLPLNDQYYAFFLQNTFPYLPQPVYADPNGIIPWSDPLQFNPDGTLPNNLYFDDSLVYRIEIRQGNTQSAPLIRLIENFVPGNGSGDNPITQVTTTDNMISNSQFYEINFTSPLSITVAGTYDIAPGWQLILVGSGTCTVTRLINPANFNQINNPPYSLEIQTSLFSDAKLIQKFNNQGQIWSSNDDQIGIIYGSITAEALINTYPLSMFYVPSDGGTPSNAIAAGVINISRYEVIEGGVVLEPSTNTDLSNVAYVDIVIQLQGTGTIKLSNIQVVGQTLPAGSTLPDELEPIVYFQETIERQEDHLFHYYKQPLLYKQIPSYLVGWDFPLNPAQFLGNTISAGGNANASGYIWDQTILFQSVASGVSVSRGLLDELVLTAATNTQLAIVQYLDGAQIRKILNDEISVNLSAVSAGQNITATISLWYTTDADLPNAGEAPLVGASLITNLDSSGKPSVLSSPQWIEIQHPGLLQEAVATITTSSNTNFNDYNFNGWNLNGNTVVENATFFAIVIGTATINTGHALHINSVGMMSGSVATRPAPKTVDESLRECRYYYEMSYDVTGTKLIGTATFNGLIVKPQGVSFVAPATTTFYIWDFYLEYKINKRISPVVIFYDLDGTINSVTGYIRTASGGTSGIGTSSTGNVALSNWTATEESQNTAYYNANSFTRGNVPIIPVITSSINQGYIKFQYTLDARLGI